MIEISEELSLSEQEVTFATSRSSGPGGQNVNKVESRVTLRFDVAASTSLSDEQRERVQRKLANRIGKDGVLSVSSQRYRTQGANREATMVRLAELLREALVPERPRKRTRVPKGARKVRLAGKRKRSEVKRRRQRPKFED